MEDGKESDGFKGLAADKDRGPEAMGLGKDGRETPVRFLLARVPHRSGSRRVSLSRERSGSTARGDLYRGQEIELTTTEGGIMEIKLSNVRINFHAIAKANGE